MRRIGLLVVLLFSLGLHAQKVVRFSELELFQEEFLELIDLNKEQKTLYQYSLLPNAMLAADEFGELWIDLSNQFIRKRLVQPEVWEELIRLIYGIYEGEAYGTAEQMSQHLLAYAKKNPSTKIRDYVHQQHLNYSKHIFSDANDFVWSAPYAVWVFAFEKDAPVYSFEAEDLYGRYREDSTQIIGANFKYYPEQDLIKGEGGTVFWSRVLVPEDERFAELDTWNLDVKKGGYQAKATLHAYDLYPEPIKGTFEDRMTGTTTKRYPKFTSERNDYLIEDIFPDVHFKGGLGVIGAQFFGNSPDSTLGELVFTYKTDTVITLKGGRFGFQDSLIASKRVEVVAHLGEDSIYHPYCEVRYDPRSGQLRILRFKTGLGLSSWIDSYHAMEVNVDQLVWNQGTPVLNFRNLNLGSMQAAVFESKQFFRITRMEEIAGLQQTHPLINLRDAAYAWGYNEVPLKDLIYALRMPMDQGEKFLYEMAIQGFVTFDEDQQTITLTDRLFEYLLNWEGKRDYDVIQFVSRVEQGNNAQVSLLNYQMDIAGIGMIAVSDSQQVNLFPKGGLISVNQGMNFNFEGRINAGLFSFWGTEYAFNYDNFMIDMPRIDSMRFKVKEFNSPPGERAALVDVQTVLSDLQGRLFIDSADNKSSREFYPDFPIFEAINNSYVYYDHPRIYNGIYERSSFYMAVEPFTIDSLDNTTTDGLLFDATFHSADIFPIFPQPLKVMPDYSLGFQTQMPPTPAYKSSGTYEGTLALSNQGLHAEGSIDYIQSHLVSKDILFFPRQASGRAAAFEITENTTMGGGYPFVKGKDNPFLWLPYDDELQLESQSIPFDMYGTPKMVAEGKLRYGGKGLFGTGELRYGTAKHNSDNEGYQFFHRSFTSAVQDFRVKTKLEDEQWAYQMLDATCDVNFDKQLGLFDKLNPYSTIEFPANQYMAYMDHAEWSMDKATVDINHNTEGEAYMVSTHPLQDSLDFTAGFARFSLVSSILEAFDVPEIEVADSRVLPDSGYVLIRMNADIDPLENARIVANRFTELHEFYESVVRIRGKYRYTARGMYDYEDEEGSTWPIGFESIKPDTSGTTIGEATIVESDEFHLSPYFGYRGKISLRADEIPMYYLGSIKLLNDCKNLKSMWYDIATTIDPADIVIQLPENDPTSLADNTFNGIYISQDSLGGHSNFLSKYADRRDIEVISADGVLFYDNEEEGYVITTTAKLKNFTTPDPYLVFYNYDCELYGTGILQVLRNTGLVENRIGGAARHDLNKDEVTIDAIWSIDAPLDKEQWETLAQLFGDFSGTNRSYDYNYQEGIYSLMGSKNGANFLDDIAQYEAEGKFPKEMRKSLVLSQIEMRYSGRYKSFQGNGEAIIQNIYNVPVFAKVDCLVEIKERSRGGEFTLYLDNGTDYVFINYKGNLMSIRSSDDTFNDAILAKDTKDRSVAAKGDRPGFSYNLAGKGKIMLLKRRFGIED